MRILFWILIAVTAFVVMGWFNTSNSAMTECQEKHSYETCVHILR